MGYVAGSAFLDAERFGEALEEIERAIGPIVGSGEKISCELGKGGVVDCTVRGFEVLKGHLFEVYSYESLTAAFIRVYLLKDKEREWIAVYIDENPQTPWWSGKDRV